MVKYIPSFHDERYWCPLSRGRRPFSSKQRQVLLTVPKRDYAMPLLPLYGVPKRSRCRVAVEPESELIAELKSTALGNMRLVYRRHLA
jgi:hypothetical protein